jgi:glutamate---cysteine ligase / carboxylate-amine ligase
VQIPFTSSPHASIGIEWELQLVDLQTRELGGSATELLAELAGNPEGTHPKAKHELLEACVEVITGVSTTVDEALADLAGTVGEVAELAAGHGLGLMGSGTHPTSDWAEQRISPDPRYAKLVESMQWLARQLQIFGVHVHVGVRSPDKAIPIVNALTAYVPHFLALSASSPYWMGRDTGLASARSKVFEGLPTAGLPYQLSGWDDFENFMGTLISAKTVDSVREVWWDVRPHPQFGTVELRICDGLPTLYEVGWAGALAQSLVEMLNLQLDRGYTLPTPRSWTLRENKWRAARYGLEAELIVDEHGRTEPLRDLLAELVAELTPVAQRLGCAEELARIPQVVAVGPSYARQRAAAEAAGGDLHAVVDALLAEKRTDLPAGLARSSVTG